MGTDKQMTGRILVIEDSKVIRSQIVDMLDPLGCDIDQAENGMAGLEMVTRQSYDLITSDVVMPKINGIQFVRFCKQLAPEVPVMIVTSQRTVEIAMSAVKVGAYEYVTKPIDVEEFSTAVERGLSYSKIKKENARLLRTLEEMLEHAGENLAGHRAELEKGLYESLRMLATTIDLHDKTLGEHGRRIATIAKRISRTEDPLGSARDRLQAFLDVRTTATIPKN